MKHIIMSLAAIALATAGALTSCGVKSSHNHSRALLEIQKCDSLPDNVKQLVMAVANNDSAKFASLVSYPLTRPYPLHDIADAKAMKARYGEIVDDSLRQVITESSPAAWSKYGWRGWTLYEGDYLWIDESLYDISYLSAREKVMLDSLIKADLATLPEGLRRGWTPELCLMAKDGAAVYRIDARDEADGPTEYRLMVYPAGLPLTGTPSKIYTGYREVEGSAAAVTYYFSDNDGGEAVYGADIMDNSQPELLFTAKDGTEAAVSVTPRYWLELVNSSATISAR